MRVSLAVERQLPSSSHSSVRSGRCGSSRRPLAAARGGTRVAGARRARRPRQPRELREAERHERKRVAEAEAAASRRRHEFLTALQAHTDEFKSFHREARKTASRLGKAVLASFDSKARKDRRDGERAQRERLKALKENNMEEYMKLVSDSKNERITQLLQETDKYLAGAWGEGGAAEGRPPPQVGASHRRPCRARRRRRRRRRWRERQCCR